MRPQDRINEHQDLQTIVTSPVIRRILGERKIFLQKKANEYIRTQDWIKAYGFLAQFDDINKFLQILEEKLENLKKEK